MAGKDGIATCTAVLLAAASLTACASTGSSSAHEVVARVGGQAITKATLAHWMIVLKGGSGVSHPSGGQEQALRKQALELLLSRQWLIGAAANRGISISAPQVHQQIDRIERTGFPGGVAELHEFLKATGQTIADLELQARAELASAKLRRTAIDSAPPVTQTDIAAYYAGHKQSFLIPERRVARSAATKKRSDAEKLKREVEAGKSLTSPDERRTGELFTTARVPPTNPYEAAIDSAKPHVVAGPFSIVADYWLYEVVRIIPARQRTLAQVSDSIRHKLTDERRRKALADFVRTWTAEWLAKTDCKPGYVVERCRQHRGPMRSVITLDAQ